MADPRLKPEDIEWLKQQGIDPESVVINEPEAMSGGRAALSTLKAHAGGIAGGGVGTLAGVALAPETGGLSLLIPIAAGLAGGFGGQKIQNAVLPDELNRTLSEESTQAEKEHPIISGATDIAASALASGGAFSPKTVFRAGRGLVSRAALSAADQAAVDAGITEAVSQEGKSLIARKAGDIGALKNVALQAGINPAIDTGVSLATGNGVPSPTRLISDVAGGALFARPSFLGRKFGMHDIPSGEPTEEPTVKGLENIDIKNQPAELSGEQKLKMKVEPETTTAPPPVAGQHEGVAPPPPSETTPPTKPAATTEEVLGQSKVKQTQLSPEEQAKISNVDFSEGEHTINAPPKTAPEQFTKQEYSPEDLAQYNKLKQDSLRIIKENPMNPEKTNFSDEWMANQKEFESLRNKYGGMPPAQLESNASGLYESRVISPKGLVEHISIPENKPTTGSVLQHIANSEGHVFQPIAKHLLEVADKESLKVPWLTKYTSGNEVLRAGYWSGSADKVYISPREVNDTRVVMEEAIHSMTAKKLMKFRGREGEAYYNTLKSYVETGDNEAVKDIVSAYLKTADHLGYSDMMFKDSPDDLEHKIGLAGNPDEMSRVFGKTSGHGSIPYAMGNLDEFIAHAFKNEQFQRLLNEIPSGAEGKSVWQRIVDAVRRLLGFDIKQGNMLEHVLSRSSDIIAQERPIRNALQKQSTTKEVPHVGETGKDLPQGSKGIRSSEQGNEVTLNSPPSSTRAIDEVDTTRKGFLRPLEATFDKVDRDSKLVGDAGRNWEKRKDQFIGMRNVALSDLSQFDRKTVNEVMAKHREAFRTDTIPTFRTPQEQKISDILQGYYGKIADIRRDVGLKIGGRKAGKNPYYVPDQLNDKALDLFVNKTLTPEAQYAKNQWVDHVFKEAGGTYSKEQIRSDIGDYIAALGGRSNNYESVHFGAIRRAQGYGLPEGLRDTDAISTLHKYGSRAASDLALYMELETKPLVAASLKLKDPNTGEMTVHPESNTDLAAATSVRDMMKWVTNGFVGTMGQSMPKVNATVRLVNNALLGTATGLRDTVQMPVFALPYINKFSDLSSAVQGILNYRNESRNALTTAARKPSIDKIVMGDIMESPDRFTQLLNKAATLMRVGQGREAIENFNRDVTFSVGKELARNNIIGAKAGDKQSLGFLQKFGTLVEGDPITLKGPELEAALNQMAKNFTDRNQGAYGGSGLPAGIIESQFAPFFALQKWSVEKSNVIYKDVVKPFIDGSNRLPLITYTLGTVLSGAAIQQLNELLSGRKSQDPTIKEALAKGDVKSVVGELATIMQLASLGGIVGDGLKWLSDISLYGKTPRNIVSFPTATAALDLQEKTTDMIEALKLGENPWDVWKGYTMDLLSHNVQMLRLIANHTVKSGDLENSDQFRDLRVFNQLEGGKASDYTPANQYLNLDAKTFKKTGDVQEAVQELPGLLQKAITDSDGDPYELLAKLRSLKGNSFQTMPSIESMPIKFLRYVEYLKRTQGEEAATAHLQDYLQQNVLNKAKSAMVP